MGNLGRAGYGATNEGLWPYTYDSCDVGTLPNQTYTGTELPTAAVSGGDEFNGGALVSGSHLLVSQLVTFAHSPTCPVSGFVSTMLATFAQNN